MKALVLVLVLGCSRDAGTTSTAPQATPGELADVTAVETSGQDGAWTFAVTIQSPDTGCKQYAQWWEVADDSGNELLYRRILMHSHADEQPFTRDGGPVKISGEQPVVVRAWMLPGGYGGQAMQGTASGGFSVVELPSGWGSGLASQEPLPEDCAF